MAWWADVLRALWLFLPAYVANMSPVFSAKLVPRWSAPIDGGRLGADGHRLLGPGKTWRGLAGAAIAGGLTSLALAWLAPPFTTAGLFAGFDFAWGGYAGGAIGSDGYECTGDDCARNVAHSQAAGVFLFGAVVGTMALVGDAVKSYFKRRRGKERGAPWFPFDQLDFVVFGLVGAALAAPLLWPAPGWALEAYFGDWIRLATLLVLTPLLHWLVNVIGYWLKLKEVPW